jgi:D-beta-D-heptose 7-phosphate kinase/D-beta-D-heptose 1-phosphate adenosyltransferase
MSKKTVIAIASGYFNPLHKGHIELFEKAREIADKLIVIVNNDKQRELKGSKEFQTEDERCKIISSLRVVDGVLLSIDEDRTVRESLKLLYERYKKMEVTIGISGNPAEYKLIFVNGGDQFSNEVAERDVCQQYGIYMIDGMGGKIQSSSWLLSEEK